MIIHPETISIHGLIFGTDSLFEQLTYSEVDFWHFSFANGINVGVEGGFWRLLIENKIASVSYDHGQKFGLPAHIDLTETVPQLLKDKNLTEIKVVGSTGDLVLSISANITIEIFITSSGYESYSFHIDNKRYIGMGSGQIAVYNTK